MTDHMEKNIKDYREKELKSFIFAHILLLLLESGFIGNIVQSMGEDNVWKAIGLLFDSSVLSAVLYIYIFIADSLIPRKIKNKLIWPIIELPGNVIFAEIRDNNKDDRFTSQKALSVYSDLYKKMGSEADAKKNSEIQNEYWYKIYQKHEKEAQVYVSQQDFLLCQDMTVLTLWIFIGTILFSFYTHRAVPYKLCIVSCIEFVALWLSSRVKGNRFACNVIAKDLAGYDE